MMYAMPVHNTAMAATAPQARSPGVVAGQNHRVGSASTRAAPSRLPVADARAGTPVR